MYALCIQSSRAHYGVALLYGACTKRRGVFLCGPGACVCCVLVGWAPKNKWHANAGCPRLKGVAVTRVENKTRTHRQGNEKKISRKLLKNGEEGEGEEVLTKAGSDRVVRAVG